MAFDWKGTIGKVAPWLTGLLAGPAAGVGADLLCKAVGLEPSLENAQKAAQMAAEGSLTGEQFLSLKKAEQDAQLKAQEMGYASLEALEKIAADDRASARDREVKTGDSWTPRSLAALVVISWTLVTWFLLKHIIPQDMREIIMRSLGTLDMALGLVLGYYFGSSAGSARKDEIMGSQK